MAHIVSLDLETMSTEPNAVVVSIGAVKVDTGTGLIIDKFYRVLPVQEQEKVGRHVSASTMAWWCRQSDEARSVFSDDPRAMVIYALYEFIEFMQGVDELWGYGSDFDNVILRSLFESFNVKAPWTHRQNRCLRTLKAMYPDTCKGMPKIGVEHNALDDAEYQAHCITLIRSEMGTETV